MNKIAIAISSIALIISLVALNAGGTTFGGTTHFSGPVDSAAGFTESGTTIISTDKALSGITTAAFSSNVTVGGTLYVTSTLTVIAESNLDTVIYGGDKTTLTAGTTTTITAAQLCDSSIIQWAPTAADSTTTLPTSTSTVADCLITDGDSKILLFRNTGAAASTTNIVAGTGMVLLQASSTADVIIAGGTSALLHVIRDTSSSVIVIFDELKDAD